MENRTTVWPYDILNDPKSLVREHPYHLSCFLICPFTPKEKFDDIFSLVQKVCKQVGTLLSCVVDCKRADKITSSGVIHAEIWDSIRNSDVIIADVSGLNGNAMIELGVASACRKKEHVIILKEENEEEHFLFDIGPARHIIYKRTFQGFSELQQNLSGALLMALTSAPREYDRIETISLPLSADFTTGRDVDWLIGPNITHRRITEDYLDFGSLFVFMNSWLSISNLEISQFDLKAEMKFSKLRGVEGWIGISTRNHHFFANYGHLLYLTSTGRIVRTVPEDQIGNYHNEEIGKFDNFNPNDEGFYNFHVRSDDKTISMFIDQVGKEFKISEMPHVSYSGKILFQTYNCRVAIKNVVLKQL